jgi:hypothetical protein
MYGSLRGGISPHFFSIREVLTFSFRGLLFAVTIPLLVPIIHPVVLISSSIVVLDEIVLGQPIANDLLVLVLGDRVVDFCILWL